MPSNFDPSDPASYPFAMFRLIAVMENLGMGKLDLGQRHNLGWDKYTDGHGGRGIIYAVATWEGG